jgi:large subunit ribosomal protein L30
VARHRKKLSDKEDKDMAKLRITLVKSPIACQPKQRKTVEALGLRKLHHSVELEDSPATRGAINKVSHLLKVEEL